MQNAFSSFYHAVVNLSIARSVERKPLLQKVDLLRARGDSVPFAKRQSAVPAITQDVVREHHLREIDTVTLAAKLQQRRELFVEDGSLLSPVFP